LEVRLYFIGSGKGWNITKMQVEQMPLDKNFALPIALLQTRFAGLVPPKTSQHKSSGTWKMIAINSITIITEMMEWKY
jgi:hypothetical protein